MKEIDIKFSKSQKLPDGYKIQWWEADEHYHWVNKDDCSCAFATRWQAFRAAWTHNKINNIKIN